MRCQSTYSPAILLGAYVGLRVAEAAALRPGDVDFLRGIVTPVTQYPADPLKSDAPRTPVLIPCPLTLVLSAAVARGSGQTIVTDAIGRPTSPWAMGTVPGLPEGFRYHDLRHHFASLLIASGSHAEIVQERLRHASPTPRW
jgi:integrase